MRLPDGRYIYTISCGILANLPLQRRTPLYTVKMNFRFKIILDVNGDKYLDAYELEAIFQYELDKIYDPNNPEVVSILFVVSWLGKVQWF